MWVAYSSSFGYTGAEVCRHYDIKLSNKEFIAKPLYPRLFLERAGSIVSEQQASLPTWAQERLGQREPEAAPQP